MTARPALLVVIAASLLALLVTMPVALHPTTYIYGSPGDPSGAVTVIWWQSYALTHGLPLLDNPLQGVPLGSDWSQIPFSPLPLFIYTPLSLLVGPVLTYNLVVLSAFVLTAWTTFLLARRLGATDLGAAFAGLSFAFIPYHLEKAQGHANQTHLELLVAGLLCLTIWRMERRWKWAAAAGVMFGLQTWLEPSIAYVMAPALAACLLASALVALATRADKLEELGRHVAAGALMAVAAVPFLPVMFFFLHRPGTPATASGLLTLPQRSLYEVTMFGARLHEYLQPYYNNPLLPASIKRWELAHLHASNWAESSILLGYAVIALALIGVALTRRAFPIALAIMLIAVGGVLAEAPVRAIFGMTVHFPSYYFVQVIPTFRVYSRFAWMVLLGAALLAGLGLTALESRLKPGRLHILLLVPFLLAAIEFNNLPPFHVVKLLPAPAEYTWLRDQPQGVLMEYPANAGNPVAQEIELRQYLLYQMVHLHPTFLTETETGPAMEEAKKLEPYYAPGVIERLKAYRVRYVFVHTAEYRADGFDVPRAVDGLTYVTTLDGVDVYVVG
ncbi:MAG: hypothetical protein M3077_13270 [Candidatus Dormibacteraeota bacterium]|nr:hypothetical protein [Candidatus Dormibacteraeota bacterium]